MYNFFKLFFFMHLIIKSKSVEINIYFYIIELYSQIHKMLRTEALCSSLEEYFNTTTFLWEKKNLETENLARTMVWRYQYCSRLFHT